MELIDRYIYAVTKRLPQCQREEAGIDLRQRIEGLLQERKAGAPYSQEDVEAVLNELGEPSRLADEYRGGKRYLIGPDFFDTYLVVLRIVVAISVFGVAIGKSIELVSQPLPSVALAIGGIIGAIFSAAMQSFAMITIIFAINERFNIVKREDMDKKRWHPSDLPRIPVKRAVIKRSEPIFGILFSLLFTLLFLYENKWLGVYHVEKGQVVSIIPVFSAEGIQQAIPWFLGLLALSILKEILKFIVGKWTLSLSLINILLNLISLYIAILIFANPGIWNGNFVQELSSSGMLPADYNTLQTNWGLFTHGFIYFIVLGFLIDSLASLAKGIKSKWF